MIHEKVFERLKIPETLTKKEKIEGAENEV